MNNKRIIWTHSFRNNHIGSGIFMHEQLLQFHNFGIKIDQICFKNIFNPLNFILQYFKYKNLNPDIIHAQYGSGNGFLTSLLNAKRKILTIRGSDWYFHRDQNFFGKIRSYMATQLTIKSLKRFDFIIVMSNRIKNEIIDKYPQFSFKIYVITDGIDLKKFYPVEKQFAKDKIKQNRNSFLIGLGSIDPNNSIKNIPLAFEAIKISKSTIPSIEFIVISNIQHDKVYLYLSACDMILLTSEYEGWPNIIKEGLACNTPFVATDVSDLYQIAEKSKFCFTTASNAGSISTKIIELHNKLLISKPNNLLEIASEFALPTIINKIIKIYKL